MPDAREPATATTRSASGPPAPASARGRWWRLLLLLAIVGGALALAAALDLGRYTEPAVLRATVAELRAISWIAPAFVVVYALGASAGLPATPFAFTGAALFGVGLGSLLNWIAGVLGATGGFLVARTLGHGALADAIRRRAPRLDALVAEHGFLTMLRLRLIPGIPFIALNYGAGLAGMRLAPYVVSSALGMLPGTIVYTALGDAIADGATGGGREAFVRAGVAGLALIAISFVPGLLRRRGRGH